jgi:hypothetical protein
METSRLDDQPETFNEGSPNDRPAAPPIAVQELLPIRTQFLLNQKMIQVQNTWFIYNWVASQGQGQYPTYEKLAPEFFQHYKEFERFVDSAALGGISPLRWEVTYVNHVEQGQLWQVASEWQNVIEGFCPLGPGSEPLEAFAGEWIFTLEPSRSRLRVAVVPVRIPNAKPMILRIILTATGLLTTADLREIREAFDLGHDAIVRRFTGLTTAKAHAAWGRKA